MEREEEEVGGGGDVIASDYVSEKKKFNDSNL